MSIEDKCLTPCLQHEGFDSRCHLCLLRALILLCGAFDRLEELLHKEITEASRNASPT